MQNVCCDAFGCAPDLEWFDSVEILDIHSFGEFQSVGYQFFGKLMHPKRSFLLRDRSANRFRFKTGLLNTVLVKVVIFNPFEKERKKKDVNFKNLYLRQYWTDIYVCFNPFLFREKVLIRTFRNRYCKSLFLFALVLKPLCIGRYIGFGLRIGFVSAPLPPFFFQQKDF